jgi:hypothetical protein
VGSGDPIAGRLHEPEGESGECRRVGEGGEVGSFGDLDVTELGVEFNELLGEDGAALADDGALEGDGEWEGFA